MSLADLAEYEMVSPRTLAEACEALSGALAEGTPVWPVAGCTDWMVERHLRPVAPQRERGLCIDVTRLQELRGIEERGGVVRIGAAEPYLAIRRSELLQRRCPMLVQMASEVGALQIQARGTLGGNLVTGSPAADGVTALMALDAQVVLASVTGERAVLLGSFYTGYKRSVRRADELVVRFELVLPREGAVQAWRKVGTRSAQSISKASVAMVVERDGAGLMRRVGLAAGSVGPTVMGLGEARARVLGSKAGEVDLDGLERAVDAGISPMDDLRSTARYRRHVTRTLVRRFFEGLAG